MPLFRILAGRTNQAATVTIDASSVCAGPTWRPSWGPIAHTESSLLYHEVSMTQQHEPAQWSASRLETEEALERVSTSDRITETKVDLRSLAIQLESRGPLPVHTVQWLLNIAYVALDSLMQYRISEEYKARYGQRVSQNIDDLLSSLVELPPNTHLEMPDWLKSLEA